MNGLDVALVAAGLGLAVWHIAKVMSIGSLFWEWREWRDTKLAAWGKLGAKLAEGWSCRLCFGTQWAIGITTAALLITRLSYGSMGLPVNVWAFGFVMAPFTVAGIAEALRKFE